VSERGAGRGGVDLSSRTAVEGSWPVLPSERTWGSWALFGISASAAVATWCYIIGGYVAYYLPAVSGTIAMIAGSLVGILLIVLATMPVATKHGIDSIASSIPQLGTRGSYYSLFLLYVSVIGWNCLLLIFLGRASAEILISFGLFGEGTRQLLVILFSLAGALVVWALLRGGPDAMRNVGPVIAVTVVLLGIYILGLLIVEVGWSNILSAKPSYPNDSKLWNYVTGFEIMVASMLSWWPYVGGMVRLVPSARKALWPVVFGLGVPVALLSIIGLFAGLAFPNSGGDPTAFLVKLGGLVGGVPALLFIILANVGTVLVGVYVSAIGLKQLPVLQKRLSWNATTGLALLPVAFVIIFFTDFFFDRFGTFLAFIGVFFAPICGIQIVDYYLFRRRRVDIRGMFRGGPGTPYHFWGGINPVGFLSLAAGFAVYIYLLNPVSYVSHEPYEFVSASIPSAVAAAIVYMVLTRLLVLPARRGGYAEAQQSASGVAREPAGARASAHSDDPGSPPKSSGEPV
jgi:nucleobase:cation symporter-1, NCS1 family